MKIITLTFFFLFMSVLYYGTLDAKDLDNTQMLVLDKYSVPINIKGAKIGTFVTSNTDQVSIANDPSGLFEIGKDNQLQLKKNVALTSDSPAIYTIAVKNGTEETNFDIVKDEFLKNKVIAHRGVWKHTNVDQNTLGSVSQAIKLGCEAAEIDVWLTKDKKVVLCHDMDLHGRVIEKTNLADIKSIQLKNNESAPTLEECLALLKTQNKTRLVVELKSNKSNANVLELADSVVNIVARMNAQAWVDYISFDYRGLKSIRAKDATAHISFLEPAVDLDLQKLDGMSGIDYHHSVYESKERLFERCKVLELTTNAWTVNDEPLMKQLLNNGIDFITTDEPELLLKVVSSK